MHEDSARVDTPADDRSWGGRGLVVALIVAAVLAVAAIVVFRSATGPDPIAARVPGDAAVFAQVTLQPSLSQQRLLEDLAERLPGGADGIEALLDRGLDELLEPVGLDADDRRRWIGDQLAFVVWAPDEERPSGIVVAHAKDLDGAELAVHSLNEQAGRAASLDRGFVTVAEDAETLEAFLEAVRRGPLTRDRSFRNARERVGGDGVLLTRVDLEGAAALAPSAGIAQTEAPSKGGVPRLEDARVPDGRVVAGVRLVEGGVQLTLAEETPIVEGPLPAPDDLALLRELAANAHAAVGFHDLAALIRSGLDAMPEPDRDFAARLGLDLEEDVLSWLGGELAARIVWRSEDALLATLLVEASDEPAMRSLVQTIRASLALGMAGEGVEVSGEEDDRFVVRTRDLVAAVALDGPRMRVDVS
ncbi:MAG TPA: hypothetical protein VNT23_06975, partial [Gaiellaceae bacterium]|nr:hypothetical protein [Gaiellaceae bacterium]